MATNYLHILSSRTLFFSSWKSHSPHELLRPETSLPKPSYSSTHFSLAVRGTEFVHTHIFHRLYRDLPFPCPVGPPCISIYMFDAVVSFWCVHCKNISRLKWKYSGGGKGPVFRRWKTKLASPNQTLNTSSKCSHNFFPNLSSSGASQWWSKSAATPLHSHQFPFAVRCCVTTRKHQSSVLFQPILRWSAWTKQQNPFLRFTHPFQIGRK